jgi:hypothetical protein
MRAAVLRAPLPRSAIKDLHRTTAEELGVDAPTREEIEELLTQLQQLLVGISIMQVGRGGRGLCNRGDRRRAWRRDPGCWTGS